MKRIAVSTILLGMLAAPGFAQNHKTANFNLNHNYTATTITYCTLNGIGGSPFSGPITGNSGLITSGSSTTVTSAVASTSAFKGLVAGDVIMVNRAVQGSTVTDIRSISSKGSDDSIVIDTAANWQNGTSGFGFRYLKLVCGTSDTSGWISTSGLVAKSITLLLTASGSLTGGLDARVECLDDFAGALPNPVWPGAVAATADCGPGTYASGVCNYTTAGLTTGREKVVISRDIPCGAIRVGLAVHTSGSATLTVGLDAVLQE